MTEEILSVLNGEVFGVWFLIGAALVFWMQAGFAMVETGFTRAKNAGNILMKNLMDFCIGTVVFILIGFSLLLGEDMASSGNPDLTFLPIMQILTGQTSYSTLCSVQQPLPSYPVQWQNVQSSFPTVYTPESFPQSFIRLKHTGHGAAAGFPRSASMISQVPTASTWSAVFPL